MIKLLRWKSGAGRRRTTKNIAPGRQAFFTRDIGSDGKVGSAHISVTANDGYTYQLVLDKEQFDNWVEFINS